MANESSTKPTYEMLEETVAALSRALTTSEKETETAEAELLRVRGLLQRSREALLSCQESANTNPLTNGICIACGAAYDHYTNCVLLSSGAESADIGKLDSADESGVESKSVHLFGHDVPLPPGIEKLVADSIDAMTEEQLAKFRKDSAAIMEKSRGSAETGGEKAAPVKSAKEFREYYVPQSEELGMMFSCEQVEELMTKFAESREPEKLNNAQKVEGK